MKKIQKSLMCILLSVILLVSVLPMTVYADSATVINVGTAEELTNACSTINAGSGAYVINLTADITGGSIDISNGSAVVTVIGNGHTIARPNGYTPIIVSDGATVNLGDGNSTLTISSGDDTGEPGIVYVMSDSVCNMYDKVTLKDHKGDNYLGGGVTVEGGTFHMYGGTIDNCGIDGGAICYGGGVAVFAGGTFVMDGGTITDCYAKSSYTYTEEDSIISEYKIDYRFDVTAMGGGVFVSGGSTFIMNNGVIKNNTASNTSEGSSYGGGIAVAISSEERKTYNLGNIQSRAVINGGTITDNTADYGAGISVSGYYSAFVSGLAAPTPESGTTDNPGFYMNGGAVSNNTAAKDGGGVYICGIRQENTIPLSNVTISNNTASAGAGMMITEGMTEAVITDCTVSGNASASYGGGICLTNNAFGDTLIQRTSITGNTTTNNNNERGAGVYYDTESKLELSGANTIQNNKYNNKLNNLNILSLKKPAYVAGDLTGSQIGVSDPTLWDDDKEDTDADAVSTLRLTSGFKANNASLIPADAFTSDHESWIVDYGESYGSQDPVYKYTAKKYDNTLGLSEGYDVNTRDNGEIFIKVPATTFSGYTENVGYLYNELCSLYGNNTDFSMVQETYYQNDPSYSSYPCTIFYDSKTELYIAVFRMGNSGVYVLSSTNQEQLPYLSYDEICLFSSGNVQKFLNGEEGVLGLRVDQYYDDTIGNDTYTEVELEYDTQLDFEGSDTKTIYKINEYGIATTKYIISKSSEDDGSYDYTGEVRLIHDLTIDYHINNEEISSESYNDEDLFTDYVNNLAHTVKVGDTIEAFYPIPNHDTCYIFKGWYYDQDNDDDDSPVAFGTDKYTAGKDIYAHWIKIEDVDKDEEDTNDLPPGETKYGGFDLAGVQIRKSMMDYNFDEITPGGMRFVTSLSMDVVNEINAIQPNNIEYGYVAATHEGWINYHLNHEKLQYVSETANGIDTSSENATDENYFGFAKNINCTSKRANRNGVVALDHQNYNDYLIYSLVITYEEEGDDYSKNVLARPYIHYTDANGLERVAYSEYRGTNVLGGCYTNYDYILNMDSSGN